MGKEKKDYTALATAGLLFSAASKERLEPLITAASVISILSGDQVSTLAADAEFAVQRSRLCRREVKQAVSRLHTTRRRYEGNSLRYVEAPSEFFDNADALSDELRMHRLRLESSIKVSMTGSMKHLEAFATTLFCAVFTAEGVGLAQKHLLEILEGSGLRDPRFASDPRGMHGALYRLLCALPADYLDAARTIGQQPQVRQAMKEYVAELVTAAVRHA